MFDRQLHHPSYLRIGMLNSPSTLQRRNPEQMFFSDTALLTIHGLSDLFQHWLSHQYQGKDHMISLAGDNTLLQQQVFDRACLSPEGRSKILHRGEDGVITLTIGDTVSSNEARCISFVLDNIKGLSFLHGLFPSGQHVVSPSDDELWKIMSEARKRGEGGVSEIFFEKNSIVNVVDELLGMEHVVDNSGGRRYHGSFNSLTKEET